MAIGCEGLYVFVLDMIHVQFRHVFVWAYLLLTAYVNLQYEKQRLNDS